MSQIEPGDREEMLLLGILNGDTETNIDPATRKEALLKAILEAGPGGLPDHDAGDDGKVLTVDENGNLIWTAAPSGNLPTVSTEDNTKSIEVVSGEWSLSDTTVPVGAYLTPDEIYTGRWLYTMDVSGVDTLFLKSAGNDSSVVYRYKVKGGKTYRFNAQGGETSGSYCPDYATSAEIIPTPTTQYGTGKPVIISHTGDKQKHYYEVTPAVDCFLYVGKAYGGISSSDSFCAGYKSVKPVDIFPLYGKTIVNFGDSIFGNMHDGDSISSKLGGLTGATVLNCGFGGTRMSKYGDYASDPDEGYGAFSMFNLANAIATNNWTAQDTAAAGNTVLSYFKWTLALLKSIDFTNVDIVTIAFGTNDYTANKAIDVTDKKDINTFGGALRYSIEKLLTAHPHLCIFVCSPTYRFWMDGNHEFTGDSNTKQNGANLLVPDYGEAAKSICEEYNLPFIDNYNIGIGKFTRTKYFPTEDGVVTDGTHPNGKGNELIARNMAKELC